MQLLFILSFLVSTSVQTICNPLDYSFEFYKDYVYGGRLKDIKEFFIKFSNDAHKSKSKSHPITFKKARSTFETLEYFYSLYKTMYYFDNKSYDCTRKEDFERFFDLLKNSLNSDDINKSIEAIKNKFERLEEGVKSLQFRDSIPDFEISICRFLLICSELMAYEEQNFDKKEEIINLILKKSNSIISAKKAQIEEIDGLMNNLLKHKNMLREQSK